MDAINDLVDFIINTKYEDLPASLTYEAKKSIIDGLGATIAGSMGDAGKIVSDLVMDWGGKPEATVAVYGQRVPCHNAVWANAVMTRCRELDSHEPVSGDHTEVGTNPPALAIAELVGGISGKDMITAVVLGTEFVVRLRAACKRRTGVSPWNTGSYAVFPAVAVAGKLMKFNKNTMLDAVGIAFGKMSNTAQFQREGTLAMCVHHGLNSSMGVLGAILAEKGVSGPHQVLEGPFGMYPAFEQNQYDRNVLLDGLGRDYYLPGNAYKPYPACAFTHGGIQGTLELVNKYNLRPDDIKSITVHVQQSCYEVVYLPVEVKKKPHTAVAAQFSIPYTAATAVVHRKVDLSHFAKSALKDPEVLKMAERIDCVVDPNLKPVASHGGVVPAVYPHIVELKTTGGKTYTLHVDHIKGDPQNPMEWQDFVNEFKSRSNFAAKKMKHTDEIIDLITHLEEVDDVNRLNKLSVGA